MNQANVLHFLCVHADLGLTTLTLPGPGCFQPRQVGIRAETVLCYFLQSSLASWLTLADCSRVSEPPGSDDIVGVTRMLFWADDLRVRGEFLIL